METLLQLAERVEKLMGPDREVDARIAVAIKLDARGLLADDHEYLSFPSKGDGCASGTYWFHCRSGMSLRTAPTYTASLDAAMTLVPEGWDWRAETFGEDGSAGTVWRHGWHDDTFIRSDAATPALALTAAALRARAGGEG